MQRKYAYFFMTLMIWQLCGFVGYFELSRWQIKKDIKQSIKQGVPISDLTVFTFSTKELDQLTWVEDHEFKFKGRMYDVVSTKNERYKTKLYCIHDKQEEKLFVGLGDAVSQKLNKTKSGKILMGWFDGMKCQLISTNSIQMVFAEILTNIYFATSNFYTFECSSVDCPPPQHDSFYELNSRCII
jgi:hypothetical protein